MSTKGYYKKKKTVMIIKLIRILIRVRRVIITNIVRITKIKKKQKEH